VKLRPLHSPSRRGNRGRAAGRAVWFRGLHLAIALGAGALIAAAIAAQSPQSRTNSPSRGTVSFQVDRLPDANDVMEIQEQQKSRDASYAAANAERKKEISDESAKLLKLAADLKAEVESTPKDTLSLNVIRQADEIEKLARGVKEKMKQSAAAK
jgi:hypothetical protein